VGVGKIKHGERKPLWCDDNNKDPYCKNFSMGYIP
jgi:hypothetical protein